MKNNLFRKFLAVFLTGTMLAGVGCKDYDDDIDKINNRLDGMDVTVADLQTQITNVKNSIPTLDELNSKVAALTSDLAGVKSDITSINSKIAAIGDVQAKLNALKSDLQAYVNGQIQTSEETLRKEIATKAAVSDIEKAVAALKAEFTSQLTSIENRIKALEGADAPKDFTGDIQSLKERLDKLDGTNGEVKALKDRLDALEGIDCITTTNLAEEINKLTTAPSWLGDAITTAIEAYQFPYATAAEATDATIESLLEKMGYANQDYMESLTDLIKKNSFSQGDLDQAIADYESTVKPLIEALDARVAELENRIQSLVWVPTTLEQAQMNTILFKSVPYITLTNSKKETKNIYLAENDGQSQELTFTVSPASMCKKIQDGATLSIEVEKLLKEMKTRADETPVFTISEPKYDLEKGKITLKVSTDYLFGKKDEDGKLRTPAIALKITMPSTVEGKAGLEYMSSFIATDFDENAEITASSLVFATKGEDGKYTEVKTKYESELLYTKANEEQIFLNGVELYYKDGDNYTRPADLWPAFPELVRTPEQADKKDVKAHLVGSDANKASYNLENVDKFAITKSATALIGDVVSSGNFGFTLKSSDYELPLGTLRHEVTIAPVNTKLEVPQQGFVWKYGQTEYVTAEVSVGGTLSADVYNELKNTPSQIVLLGKDKEGKDIEIAVAGIKIDYTTTPSEDGDAQKLKLTITDNQNIFIANGVYTVQADYELADQTTVTVLIPVKVTGMPELAAFEIPAKEFTYNGEMTYTLFEPTEQDIKAGKDVANLIWNAFSTTLKDCFTETQFTAMLKAAKVEQNNVLDDKKNVLASLTNNAFANIEVEFANTDEATYKPGLTFTNDKIVVKVTSTVTMKKPVVALDKIDEYFNEKGLAVVNTTLSSAGYTVADKELSGAFSKSAGTPKDAEIVYALNYTDKELEAMKKKLAEDLGKNENEVTMPSIANNILDWGDYNKRTLNLKASIVLNGAVLGKAAQFQVTIADPITDAAISQKKDATGKLVEAIIYEKDNPATLSIADYLVLNTINKENVYDAANAAVNTALHGKTTYTVITGSDLVTVSKDGVVTFTPEGGLELQKDVKIVVKASYSYLYDEDTPKTCEITVTVKPGAKE